METSKLLNKNGDTSQPYINANDEFDINSNKYTYLHTTYYVNM